MGASELAFPAQPRTNTHTHTHTHARTHTHTRTHAHTHTRTHTHTHTHAHTHRHTHRHTQTHTDTHTDTQTHRHTHSFPPASKFSICFSLALLLKICKTCPCVCESVGSCLRPLLEKELHNPLIPAKPHRSTQHRSKLALVIDAAYFGGVWLGGVVRCTKPFRC